MEGMVYLLASRRPRACPPKLPGGEGVPLPGGGLFPRKILQIHKQAVEWEQPSVLPGHDERHFKSDFPEKIERLGSVGGSIFCGFHGMLMGQIEAIERLDKQDHLALKSCNKRQAERVPAPIPYHLNKRRPIPDEKSCIASKKPGSVEVRLVIEGACSSP